MALIAGWFLLMFAVQMQVTAYSGSGRGVRLPAILREEQIPLSPLLVATILGGCMWWGIIAGMRWIWLAI